MYLKFEALDADKQMRILNASFDEFSRKKFREASTDEIAKKAGISKGALFQYFGTKMKLYNYIYNYGYNVIKDELYGRVDFSDGDIFMRLKEVLLAKIDLFVQYPTLFDFFVFSFTVEDDELIKQLTVEKHKQDYAEMSAKLYEAIDYSLFKPGVDIEKALHSILWTVDGYSKIQKDALKSTPENHMSITTYKRWIEEFEEYMLLLRGAFYN